MATNNEQKERLKNYLYALLLLKAKNKGTNVEGLQELINQAIVPMEKEDIADVEKIAGAKVFE